ncbi:MAG TPA: hypothetical protein VI363_01715 [Burkholderiales bacterium]
MNGNREQAAEPEGSLLPLGETREIAIYRRGGVAWVADFRGGRGELFTAGEWFALNGRGSLLRRTARDAIVPLPADVIERIERLHGAQERAPLAAPGARLLDHPARFFRALSSRAPAGVLSPYTQHS